MFILVGLDIFLLVQLFYWQGAKVLL